ncbi:MAG: isoprenyl transferase [Saccharofermentans sp.]|nr:isoprenyl transferase [Saccharofermentans sp.]
MALGNNKIEKTYDTDGLKVPVSLGVIMDGNGRWAKKRLLPRTAGHRAGAENLKELCRNCGNYGVKYLTVYAFSTENWIRPADEVNALMKLFVEFFNKYDPELEEEGIRVRFTGDIEALPPELQKVCRDGEERSKDRPKMQLIVAFNYGGRREIVQSVQKIAQEVKQGRLNPEDITEDTLSNNMYLPDVPDPELIIRPSGEMRLSNFLLWESAYSEFWVSDTLWPDFGYEDLTQAFRDYARRDRRFGGLSSKDSEEGRK